MKTTRVITKEQIATNIWILKQPRQKKCIIKSMEIFLRAWHKFLIIFFWTFNKYNNIRGFGMYVKTYQECFMIFHENCIKVLVLFFFSFLCDSQMERILGKVCAISRVVRAVYLSPELFILSLKPSKPSKVFSLSTLKNSH